MAPRSEAGIVSRGPAARAWRPGERRPRLRVRLRLSRASDDRKWGRFTGRRVRYHSLGAGPILGMGQLGIAACWIWVPDGTREAAQCVGEAMRGSPTVGVGTVRWRDRLLDNPRSPDNAQVRPGSQSC